MTVATKIELYGHNAAGAVMPFTVSDSTPIPKGTVMVLSATPRTITAHASVGQKFVGVASSEKDTNDTSDQLGVWTNGVFSFDASGSIADGDIVILSATANQVETDNSNTDPTKLVGMAFSDAAGSRVDVRVLK